MRLRKQLLRIILMIYLTPASLVTSIHNLLLS